MKSVSNLQVWSVIIFLSIANSNLAIAQSIYSVRIGAGLQDITINQSNPSSKERFGGNSYLYLGGRAQFSNILFAEISYVGISTDSKVGYLTDQIQTTGLFTSEIGLSAGVTFFKSLSIAGGVKYVDYYRTYNELSSTAGKIDYKDRYYGGYPFSELNLRLVEFEKGFIWLKYDYYLVENPKRKSKTAYQSNPALDSSGSGKFSGTFEVSSFSLIYQRPF